MIYDIPVGIIELGNINIKCLIFKINNDDTLEILSTSIIHSEGIHNGIILNISKASNAIRLCISAAEKKAEVSIKKINVIVEQPEFLCTRLSKDKKIDGSKIHKEDIEFLLKEGKKQVILNDDRQSIIHIFNHNYIADGKIFIEEPIDVYADYFCHEMTFVSMPKNNIKNIDQTFIDCDIEIERYISCTFALAAKLLNNDELMLGSILIDIGFEKTSLGIFKNLALVHSMTLPVGVNHITKDISKVCSLNIEESETIRNKMDFSFQNNEDLFDKNNNLKNSYFTKSNFRKISKFLVSDIIRSRLDEIFEIIKKQIILIGLNTDFNTNFFMVGGGSNLINLDKYCSNFFGLNIRKFEKSNNRAGQEDLDEHFNSCLGALKIITEGWETEAIPKRVNKRSQKASLFAKIFGNNP